MFYINAYKNSLQKSCLLIGLFILFFQAYLWDNNQAVVEWLEKHLSKEDGTRSAIRENIKYLKRENALKHIRRFVDSNEM